MPEYQKMYVQLFAAVTDALEAMSQQNYGQAAARHFTQGSADGGGNLRFRREVGLFFRRISV